MKNNIMLRYFMISFWDKIVVEVLRFGLKRFRWRKIP